ncbi:polyhydroxyalkanoic acid synthase subunit PhaR [Massilibacterium senegalense]|uniref:polyhydroxyalkanoic acid synthase subunit PhaR n=1 Tax=Massilibacterium senegalense TaxID=1632858 RepID=UPI00078210F1|nr:polyhydroxyalkanoic acid synthase subunit PhaR [Massilibacterium senegalense]
MSDQKTFDPFTMWKEFYNQSESYWGKVLNETMQKEEFAEFMGNVLNANLYVKKMMNESAEEFLKNTNMPSKQDLANVATLVINVEEKVDELEERLDNEGSKNEVVDVKREVTRLKTDVKNLDKKFEAILEKLEEMNATLQEASANQKVQTPSASEPTKGTTK